MFKFFLRFYNQTDEAVEECVAKLKAEVPMILGHTYSDDKTSTNFHTAPSHVVLLKFINERTADAAMMGNAKTRDIYMQYANGGSEKTTFEQRAPGQAVWRH